jgi:hypothetical protein
MRPERSPTPLQTKLRTAMCRQSPASNIWKEISSLTRSLTKSWQTQVISDRSEPLFWKLTARQRGRVRSVRSRLWMDSFGHLIHRRTGKACRRSAQCRHFRVSYAQARPRPGRQCGTQRTLPQGLVGVTGRTCPDNEKRCWSLRVEPGLAEISQMGNGRSAQTHFERVKCKISTSETQNFVVESCCRGRSLPQQRDPWAVATPGQASHSLRLPAHRWAA